MVDYGEIFIVCKSEHFLYCYNKERKKALVLGMGTIILILNLKKENFLESIIN